jgi:hypothetical protein
MEQTVPNIMKNNNLYSIFRMVVTCNPGTKTLTKRNMNKMKNEKEKDVKLEN